MIRRRTRPLVAIMGTRGYPSYYGGFETAVRHLAPFLTSAGCDVIVYSRRGQTKPGDPGRDPRVKAVFTPGLESKSLSTLSSGFFAALHVLTCRPDVVLVMNVANGLWLPLLRLARIPAAVNVDGIEWERAKWGHLGRFMFRLGAHLTARLATQIVCDSVEIDRFWRRELGRGGVFIPYGGEDEPRSCALPPGIMPGRYVLAVARLVPENSIGEFLQAVPSLTRECDVVLVGSSGSGGPLEDEARRLALANRRFHWLGQVADDDLLFTLWREAGVYFHGHTAGGTNPALVQAMALGAPVAAIDTVFSREVLGDAGVLLPKDASAIESQVLALMNDLGERRRLSEAARSRAAARYAWPQINAAYLRLLRDCARRGRAISPTGGGTR